MDRKTPKEVAEVMSDYVNSMSHDPKEFVDAFNNQHRTLQQSFTKLCMAWLENCASDDYRTDGRNEASHKISKEMIEAFQKFKETERTGFAGSGMGQFKPSQWLPLI